MSKPHFMTSIASILLVSLVAAGCASGGDEGASPTATDEPQQTETQTETETEAETETETEMTEGGLPDDVIEAAREEGAVHVADSVGATEYAEVIAAFKEDYPDIDLVHLEQGGPDTIPQVRQETDAGVATSADVINASIGDTGAFALEGDYLHSADWEQMGISSDLVVDEYQVYAQHILTALAYNTDLVSEADVPATWDALLDWDDELLVGISGWDSMAADLAQVWGVEETVEYTEALAEIATRTASVVEVAPRVAAGEFPLGVARLHHVRAEINNGAPIDFVTLEPVPSPTLTYSIPAESEHKNAAIVYIHWVNQPENHAIYEAAVGRGNALVAGSQAAEDIQGAELASFTGPFDEETMGELVSLTDRFAELIR